ncbi:IS3 family transposase [Enterococcus innesii]|uniref:IS3 family transposase n=1 Tax=Enterococcus innesii TaxID=2839759 RepID=UPI00398BB8E0
MSCKESSLDNSIMENFLSLLTQEIYYGRHDHSFEELKQVADGYIHYYNHERIKKILNRQIPK